MKNKDKNKEIKKEDERLRSARRINYDTVKHLIHYSPFQTKMRALRKRFGMPRLNRSEDEIKHKTKHGLAIELAVKIPPLTDPEKKRLIRSNYFQADPSSKWLNSLDESGRKELEEELLKIIQEFGLPNSGEWQEWLIFYLLYRGKNMPIPEYNYDLTTTEAGAGLTTGEKRSLSKFAEMNKKEFKNDPKLLKLLTQAYAKALKTKNPFRRLKDVDRDIKIVKDMKNRIMPKTVVKYDKYLEDVKKQHGEKEFERAKKLNPNMIIKKVMKHTSKEIAKKHLGSSKKHPSARKITERFKKRQKERFSQEK